MKFTNQKKKIRNIQQDNQCHINMRTTFEPYIADIMLSQAGHH